LNQISSLTPATLAGSQASVSAPLRFSLEDIPERDRPAVFREVFGRSVIRYDVEPLRNVPFAADVTLQALPRLTTLSGRLHGSCNQRTREMLADGSDDIGLIVNLRGPHRITQRQDELVLGDGEAALVSLGEPCSFTHRPPGDILALRVPRGHFRSLVPDVDGCYLRRIPRDTQALRLLASYVGAARDEQTILSHELQHAVVSHLYDLMALAVGATRDAADMAQGRGLRAARLKAIKDDIAKNIDRCDLSLTVLAARHGLAPRLVQRLFEAEGTSFTEYVVTQRLARAYRLLSDPRRGGDKISAIAWDSGFGDLSYFNQAFRKRYGRTPSDVRAQAQLEDAGGWLTHRSETAPARH
jgi:AraC-like DNA-binding protein